MKLNNKLSLIEVILFICEVVFIIMIWILLICPISKDNSNGTFNTYISEYNNINRNYKVAKEIAKKEIKHNLGLESKVVYWDADMELLIFGWMDSYTFEMNSEGRLVQITVSQKDLENYYVEKESE